MHNFMIGMWNGFDQDKYARDFRPGFFGIEVGSFPDIRYVESTLIRKSIDDNFNWGCHYPLIKNNNPTRDPLFLSLCREIKAKAFNDFRKEAELVASLGGKYILTHFPKPVLVSDTFDFTYWRFANDMEWVYAKDYPHDELTKNMRTMFVELDRISKNCGIPVVLENDAIAQYLCNDSFFSELLAEYGNVKLCLDVGRLHLNQCVDESFNGLAFAKKYAMYAYIIHLWNTSPLANLKGGHLPVSVEQRPEDGYADIKEYLHVIFSCNPDVKVLFEHNSHVLSDGELQQCYEWVDSIRMGCNE